MGYSSPKKQLDLKDFLSKPGVPRKAQGYWKRTAAPMSDKIKRAETQSEPVSGRHPQ